MCKLAEFIFKVFVLLSVFWLGCYVTGFAFHHPIFLFLAVGIESLIFLSWEIESRENRKKFYENGGDNDENAKN